MSTNSSWVGTIFADLPSRAQTSQRSSGTATRPTLGSIVQNGEVAAPAARGGGRALKRVDLPTLGSPTMPQVKPIQKPRSAGPALWRRVLWRFGVFGRRGEPG